MKLYDAVRTGIPVDVPFIDVHGHFGPWSITFVPHARDHARIIDEMDRFGCDLVWMTASEPGHAGTMRWKNDIVFELAEAFPDRILPYCTLSANEQDQCLDELKRCVARGPCVGVKMHVYHQNKYTLDDPFLQPVFEFLSEHRLVYMNHHLGETEIIRHACHAYPEISFVSGHFNPSINDLAKELPNLYDCTCAAMAPDSVGREARRLGHVNTILNGSDFSLFTLAFGIGMIAYTDMTEKEKQAVLGMNALKLLRNMPWFKLENFPRLVAKQKRM